MFPVNPVSFLRGIQPPVLKAGDAILIQILKHSADNVVFSHDGAVMKGRIQGQLPPPNGIYKVVSLSPELLLKLVQPKERGADFQADFSAGIQKDSLSLKQMAWSRDREFMKQLMPFIENGAALNEERVQFIYERYAELSCAAGERKAVFIKAMMDAESVIDSFFLKKTTAGQSPQEAERENIQAQAKKAGFDMVPLPQEQGHSERSRMFISRDAHGTAHEEFGYKRIIIELDFDETGAVAADVLKLQDKIAARIVFEREETLSSALTRFGELMSEIEDMESKSHIILKGKGHFCGEEGHQENSGSNKI